MPFVKRLFFFLLIVCLYGCDSDSENSVSVGQGGSMTRFAILNDRMYVLNMSSIQVFNVAGGAFQEVNEVSVNPGLETIFAKGDFLYLGALDGMYIYSITDKDNPSFVFRYEHVLSCDPVVVQGNRAYVTMRRGTTCNNGIDALDIINISDPYNPKLIRSYDMSSPHGLSVDGNILFVCEGEYGLKMFDIENEQNIQLKHHLSDFFAYDVITRNNIATVTGDDGIFQFSYSQENDLTLISKIPVDRAEL